MLYLSGYIDRLELLYGSLNNRTRFLAKPFIPAQLIQRVSAILEPPRGDKGRLPSSLSPPIETP